MKQSAGVAHFAGMRIKKSLAIAIAIPIAAIGWALFRPELLFINQQVNEKAPAATSGMATNVARGPFTSQAHETKGTAQILRVDGAYFLRLSGFSTSNGPDVRVQLTTGGDPGSDSLDLGSIKGNVGDQNYKLPGSFDPAKHTAVSIWCQRFSVGFGLAKLTPTQGSMGQSSNGRLSLIGFSDRTEVTFGAVMGHPELQGRIALVEEAGKRHAEIRLTKFSGTPEFRLVKKESLQAGPFLAGATFVKLIAPKKAGSTYSSTTPLDKNLDLWLYRSVAILDSKTKKTIAFVNLRSSQEKPSKQTFI